jgi:hypothetical protein
MAIDSPTTRTLEHSFDESSSKLLFTPSFGTNARISFLKLISKICSQTKKKLTRH